MTRKRNCFRYELKDGKEIVYFGITNNPERREIEHKNEGKRFTKLNIVSRAVEGVEEVEIHKENII